jgi:hypothetical protein
MAADGLTLALEAYQRAQDELVEARNRLASAIAGAAMSGMTQDEIVELTGYTADRYCGSAPMPVSAGTEPKPVARRRPIGPPLSRRGVTVPVNRQPRLHVPASAFRHRGEERG